MGANKDTNFIFRVTQDLRDRAKAKAVENGTSLSKVIRRFLVEYVREDGQHPAPERGED
jgi:hypothetical protein